MGKSRLEITAGSVVAAGSVAILVLIAGALALRAVTRSSWFQSGMGRMDWNAPGGYIAAAILILMVAVPLLILALGVLQVLASMRNAITFAVGSLLLFGTLVVGYLLVDWIAHTAWFQRGTARTDWTKPDNQMAAVLILFVIGVPVALFVWGFIATVMMIVASKTEKRTATPARRR